MTNEELLTRCRDYLSRQRCVMWGQHFNIKDEDIDEAVTWLAGEITEVVGDIWASGSESKNGDGAIAKTPRSPKPRSGSGSGRIGTGKPAPGKGQQLNPAAAPPPPKKRAPKPPPPRTPGKD